MEWRGRRGSSNIEDRRGQDRAAGGPAVGGIGALVLLLVGAYFGVDVSGLIEAEAPGRASTSTPAALSPADQEAGNFVSVVLADTEEVWTTVFPNQVGDRYRPPVLVLYRDVTRSPCGGASGATVPFYCPSDQKIYLDTAFFATMAQDLGADGDFAAAYVVAHEVAHHVQNQIGILGQAHAARSRAGATEANAISVRVELQADCLSGIWARGVEAMFGTLEAGDVEEAVNAAHRIGDDTLQRNAGRVPMPHTFTHGTSAQRARWFLRGYDSGDMGQCGTFAVRRL